MLTKCKVENCTSVAEADGFCNKHYWYARWLDNTDKENLGILLFGKMMFPHWFRNDTPVFHREVMKDYISLYSSDLKDKYDRLFAVLAFRGGAKTTLSKVILAYVCCFGLEKLVIYCSETNAFAVQDVFEVRRELGTNMQIRRYFGIINSKRVKGQDGEWHRDAFLTSSKEFSGVYVLARGVGQQIRSVLRNSYRPTLSIINDMDSKDSVKTEYTRGERQKWFFQDMLNAVDDIDGKVFFNGTILHEDTVPVIISKNETWKVKEYPVMDIDDFHKATKICEVTEDKVTLPSDEDVYALQKELKLYWPERLDLRYILRKYKEAYESGQADGFFQEYFHIVVPPEEKTMKSYKKANMSFFRVGRINWINVKIGDRDLVYNVNTFLGIDPASATTQRSKYSALLYIAVNEYRQVFVLGYSRGKYGMRDELQSGYHKKTDSDIAEPLKENIQRVGMVDESMRLFRNFHFYGTAVETIQQQQSVYDEILRIMAKNNAYHQIHSIKPTQEKIERDANIIGPYMQTGNLYINYGCPELEMELDSFPRGMTTDLIDALAMAISISVAPTGESYEELKKNKFKRIPQEDMVDFFVL